MKKDTYMTRAMQASDRRYATILGKLGYSRTDLVADSTDPEQDEIVALRAEYQTVVGKKPFHGWDAETIKSKIAEAKDAE